MKKISSFLMSLAIATLLLFSSCTSVDDYAVLIPEDAALVAKFDVMQMLLESKIGIGDSGEQMKGLFDDFDEDMPAKMKEWLKAVVDDPDNIGVDISKPFFFYGVPKGEDQFGFVGAVTDREAFENTLKAWLGEYEDFEIEKEGDVSYIRLYSDVWAYDDSRFIYLDYDFDYDYNDDLDWEEREKILERKREETAIELINEKFGAKKEDSALAWENFDKLLDDDGECAMLVSLENAMDAERELKAVARMVKPLSNIADIDVLASVSSEKGEAALSVELLPKTDDAKEYVAKLNTLMGDISGEHFKHIGADAIVAMAIGLNGEAVVDYLKEEGLYGLIVEEGEDEAEEVLDIIPSFVGDATFALNSLTSDGVPEMTFFVSDSEKKVFKLLKDELANDAQKKSSDYYVIEEDSDFPGAFGVEDETTYLVAGNERLKSVSEQLSASDFEGKKMFGRIYVDNLMNSPAVQELFKYNKTTLSSVKLLTDEIESIDFEGDFEKMELRVVMKDSGMNLLTLLTSIFEAHVSKL